MDKSKVLKYLEEIWEDLDKADTDFFLALCAIDKFDIKRTDLVLDARVIRNDLSVAIESLSRLIGKLEIEEE